MKKKLAYFTNCIGDELHEVLRHVPEYTQQFDVKTVSTYKNLNDPSVLRGLEKQDVIVCNVIKQYPLFTVDQLRARFPKTRIIRLEFFRFAGFYPLPLDAGNKRLLVHDDAYKNTETYKEFLKYEVDTQNIQTQFEKELTKLKHIDDTSDIKVYDYFITHYKNTLLFRDDKHPAPALVRYIAKELLQVLGIDTAVDVDAIPVRHTWGFYHRYKPVLPCVKDALGLTYTEDTIDLFNRQITPELFYYYIKHTYGVMCIKKCTDVFMDYVSGKITYPKEENN